MRKGSTIFIAINLSFLTENRVYSILALNFNSFDKYFLIRLISNIFLFNKALK